MSLVCCNRMQLKRKRLASGKRRLGAMVIVKIYVDISHGYPKAVAGSLEKCLFTNPVRKTRTNVFGGVVPFGWCKNQFSWWRRTCAKFFHVQSNGAALGNSHTNKVA